MIDNAFKNEIVEEVLKRLKETIYSNVSCTKKKLLIMNATNESQTEQLQKCWQIEHAISATVSDDLLENNDEIIFLDVSQNLFVKGAIGITDSADSELVAKALLKGKKIHFVPSASFEWILDVDYNKTMNKAYVSQILTYKKILETFGVQLTSFSNFQMTHSGFSDEEKDATKTSDITFNGKVLTHKDVEKIKGERITIYKSTIITPLAHDLARELGKTIDIIETKGMKK